MCEIAIMTHDRTHPDPVIDPRHFKRGDVIEVLEDGSDWGDRAMSEPWLRIIRLTGVSVSEGKMLQANERPIDPANVPRTLWLRHYRMSLDHHVLDDEFHHFLADESRTRVVYVFEEPRARAWFAARVKKSSVADPHVIGPSANVIG